MHKDLLTLIAEKRSGFSKGQRAIASYIAANYDKAVFMTASKLGATVGVSESTVVRFACILGFEGYPQMQESLQELIKNKLTAVQRVNVSVDQFGENTLSRVLLSDIEKIKQTIEETSEQEFHHAVDAISSARNIYIIGSRSASTVARFLSYYLNLVMKNVKLVHTTSTSEMFEQIMRIDENDVIVGISFPRYSKTTVKAFNFASERGANVIAITDSPASPIAAAANIILYARSNMVSFVDSLVAPMSLVNALLVSVGLKMKDEVCKSLSELEYIWDKYDIYEKYDKSEELGLDEQL